MQLLNFLQNLFFVLGVRIKLQIAFVGFDGVAFHTLFFLRFGEVAERRGIARLCFNRVSETVNRGVKLSVLHVVLANFDVFFRAVRVPLGLVFGGFRCRVGLLVGLCFWRIVGLSGLPERRRSRAASDHGGQQNQNGTSRRHALLIQLRFLLV